MARIIGWLGLLCYGAAGLGMAAQAAAPGVATPGVATPGHDKLLHRYLRMAISPDGQWTADVEGDSPPSGYGPALRDLVIRRVRDGTAVSLAMPCGRVPQCWPDF